MSARNLLPALLLAAGLAPACASSPAGPRSPEVIRAEAETLGVPRAGAPLPDVMTAGQLTPEQLDALARLGYRDFVNLRVPTEPETGWESERAAELGVRYVSLPIAGAQDVTEANAKRLSEAIDAAGGPVVVYCRSSNRVGALLALEAFFVDGESAEDSLAIGLAGGLTRLEPRVRELLGLPNP